MSPSPIRARLLSALDVAPPQIQLESVRLAAVAIVLVEEAANLELLLIERAEREGDPWSGHMALPGGHAEPHDADLAATAERETFEEVGVDLRATGERLGQLSDRAPVRARSIAVRPFVYLLTARPELALSAEVKQALWVPIAPLQSSQCSTTYTLWRAGQERRFPAWRVDGHVVWGMTYRVLDEFFRRLTQVSNPEAGVLDNSQ